jgi:light-harvesting complex 1 beta chain
MPHTLPLHQERSLANGSWAFWSIFLLAFGLLFTVVVLAKLFGLHWRELLPGAENAPGMVQGAKAAVYTFMSHII